MTKETRRARTLKKRLATTALMFAGVLGAAGCSSVPDAVNPVEWYRGASDAVGGMFGDEPEAGQTPGDPGTSANTAYPNLSTVPPRPTPSTTAEQREAMKQGLVADRANARYTEPAPGSGSPSPSGARAPAPVPQRSQPQPQSPAPRPAEPQAALPTPVPTTPAPTTPAPTTPAPVPPAAAPAAPPAAAAVAAPARVAPAADPGGRSALWPNRPAPETPGVQASTTGRVGGDEIHRSAQHRSQSSATAPSAPAAVTTAARAPASTGGGNSRLSEGTTLDSAGYGGAAPAAIPRSQPPAAPARAAPSAAAQTPAAPEPPEPSRPRVSEQSVIVNEDAITGGPAARPAASTLGGRRYLASTIYFGHGSASVTEAERQEIARIAKAAAANGAAVQVIGHASARTADLSLRDHETANLAMSMKRAQAVADVMIRAGMPSDRVIVEALADSQPEFYEVMPSGEAGNRRTEIVVIY